MPSFEKAVAGLCRFANMNLKSRNDFNHVPNRDRIMDAIAEVHNVDTGLVDGTSIRAHHAATTLKKKTRAAVRVAPGADRGRKFVRLQIMTVCHCGMN